MEKFMLVVHLLIISALFFCALSIHKISKDLKKEVKPKVPRKKKVKTLQEVRETVLDFSIFDEQN